MDGAAFGFRVAPEFFSAGGIEADDCFENVVIPTESGLAGAVIGAAEHSGDESVGNGYTFNEGFEILLPELLPGRGVVGGDLLLAAGGVDDFPSLTTR